MKLDEVVGTGGGLTGWGCSLAGVRRPIALRLNGNTIDCAPTGSCSPIPVTSLALFPTTRYTEGAIEQCICHLDCRGEYAAYGIAEKGH